MSEADRGQLHGHGKEWKAVPCLIGLSHLPSLQKQQHRGISGFPCVRLLTCTICSCKSQSISTFLNCWKAFLNTVIYPQKNREHAPSPPQYCISTNCHPRPDPTNLPTQEEEETAFKACNRQPQYICHKKNFYFSLMTLNTTATREKT